jgi:hypothetical protein
MRRKIDLNPAIFVGIIIIYIAGQFLIGTYDADNRKFVYDAPADVDFLYYGAIINQLLNDFPPENPAFGGEILTQPFLQYYPAAILAKAIGPYNGIRVLNVVYLILCGIVLRRYFPRRYGLVCLILFAGSTIGASLNSSGIDFIARGFTHTPSFILFAVALYGKRIAWRVGAIFLAALVNGYLTLIFLPFLAIIWMLERDKKALWLIAGGVLGLGLAAIYFSSALTERSLFSMVIGSLDFAPVEILLHAAPIIILAFIYPQIEAAILLAVSIIFGAFIQYNPFFPIFMVYFAGGITVGGIETASTPRKLIAAAVVLALFCGFIISAYGKYNPEKGDYRPRFDLSLTGAFAWIRENTNKTDCFLALTADENDLGLIMQYRPVYLGYIPHMAHLGLGWKERYDDIQKFYQTGEIPSGVKYIFYGPIERKYFPAVQNVLGKLSVAYRDKAAIIFATEKR